MTGHAKQPNLLYIFSDQHRAAALGCYGENQVRTPQMDSLARDGQRLTNCVSTHPVCCPYRASLMTGLYAHHTGMLSNYHAIGNDFVGLGEAFKRSGYATGYVGKWHIYFADHDGEDHGGFVPPGPDRLGFDWWAAANGGHNYYNWKYWRDDPTPIVGKDYQPFEQAALANSFIREKKGQPWCLFLSWGPPHTPYRPPEAYAHYKDLALRPNVPAGAATEYANTNLPRYYGLIESLDDALGRILAELDATGQRENTIVVYTADHGDMVGCHGAKFKRWPFDESVNVPFLIRWPKGLAAGKVNDLHLGTPDLYPTLCGFCDVPVPTKVDGRDLSGFLRGDANDSAPDYAYLSMAYGYAPWPGWKAIRTNRFAYVESAGRPWLLFDRKEDPYQMHNLVGRCAAENELRAQLATAMQACGDTWEAVAQGGDLKEWAPGSKKYVDQNLGVMEMFRT